MPGRQLNQMTSMNDNDADTSTASEAAVTTTGAPLFDETTRAELETRLRQCEQRFQSLPPSTDLLERAKLEMEIAELMLNLQRNGAAWEYARGALTTFIKREQWQAAAEACDILYHSEQPASIVALAHGIWLAVTYPVSIELTIGMLSNIVDETPDHADGAAVAAVVAHYVADMRAVDEKQHTSVTFLSSNLIARVARRHSQVETQEELDAWMDRLELRDPAVFLPRLSKILDIMAEDKWWFDRDELRAKLPVN